MAKKFKVTKKDCYLARRMYDAGRSIRFIACNRGLSVATIQRMKDMGFDYEMYKEATYMQSYRNKTQKQRQNSVLYKIMNVVRELGYVLMRLLGVRGV